jgi:hypothetical protein
MVAVSENSSKRMKEVQLTRNYHQEVMEGAGGMLNATI